jgi:hypothetical protein
MSTPSTPWQRARKARVDIDLQMAFAEEYVQRIVDADAWGHCGLFESWLTDGWEDSFQWNTDRDSVVLAGFGMAPVKAEGTRIE